MWKLVTQINIIGVERISTIIWCDAQGRALDSLNSPADPDYVAANLASWQGYLITIKCDNQEAVTRLAAHLRAQGHTVTSPKPQEHAA